MSKSEKAIVLALRLGYTDVSDLVEQTGLHEESVESSLNLLCFEYNVSDVAALVAIFAPKPPTKRLLKYTSHDCVIVDAALTPVTAANLLRQMLGENYCQQLKNEL